MAVAICVTSSRFRTALQGVGGGVGHWGGRPGSSFNWFMRTSELRAYACYREDSRDHTEEPLANGSRNGVVLMRASPGRYRGARLSCRLSSALDSEPPSVV